MQIPEGLSAAANAVQIPAALSSHYYKSHQCIYIVFQQISNRYTLDVTLEIINQNGNDVKGIVISLFANAGPLLGYYNIVNRTEILLSKYPLYFNFKVISQQKLYFSILK